jgi:hypothetical protein
MERLISGYNRRVKGELDSCLRRNDKIEKGDWIPDQVGNDMR